ncbi:LysR family transcriptional regulator [Vibrio ostreicida]|uniref:LysR family transcriptional regulator n=1 Tax=Vibrio ostreicida TaxID=526588 RepID=UPI0009707785|nr:LysR family transcriptional regulator [Vibrio ostreicida]
MNLRQIEVFYAVMQAKTVSGAAKRLHVSQPNVTRILSHTEQQLGFALFDRIKGRLVATQEAKTLFLEAEKIYQQVGQFRHLTNKIKQGAQHLRIGAPPILASGMLAPLVAEVCRRNEHSVEVSTANRDQIIEGLIKNELDLAICFAGDSAYPIIEQTILTTQMTALMPSGDDETATVSLDALLQCSRPLVGLDVRDPLGFLLQEALRNIQPNFHPKVSVRSYQMAAEMVRSGAANAVVDPWTAQHYRHHSSVDSVPLVPDLTLSVSMLFSEHYPLSISAKAFAQNLQQRVTL